MPVIPDEECVYMYEEFMDIKKSLLQMRKMIVNSEKREAILTQIDRTLEFCYLKNAYAEE